MKNVNKIVLRCFPLVNTMEPEKQEWVLFHKQGEEEK